MYYRDDKEQLSMDEFFMPFGGRLMKDNRWVRLAEMMPWEHIEEIYAQNMSEETGRPAIPSRIAFGAIFIEASVECVGRKIRYGQHLPERGASPS